MQEKLKGTVWHIDCGGELSNRGKEKISEEYGIGADQLGSLNRSLLGWYKHKSGRLTAHFPGPSLEYMDSIAKPIWEDFNYVYLKELRDPKSNEVADAQFGADVEKIAKIGPPREPTLPEGDEDLAAKIAALRV